jgi:hypothetical protein
MTGPSTYDSGEISRLMGEKLPELLEIAKTGVWPEGYADTYPAPGILPWLPNSSNALYAIANKLEKNALGEDEEKTVQSLENEIVTRVCTLGRQENGLLSEPGSSVFDLLIDKGYGKKGDIIGKLISSPAGPGGKWDAPARLSTLDLVLEKHADGLTPKDMKGILCHMPEFFIKDEKLKEWVPPSLITPDFVDAVLDQSKKTNKALELLSPVLREKQENATPGVAEKLLALLETNVKAHKDPMISSDTTKLTLKTLSEMMELREDVAKMKGLSERLSTCACDDIRYRFPNYVDALDRARDKDTTEIMGNLAERLLSIAGNEEKGKDLRDQQRKDEARENALENYAVVRERYPEVTTPSSCVILANVALKNTFSVQFYAFDNLSSALSGEGGIKKLATPELVEKMDEIIDTVENDNLVGKAVTLRRNIAKAMKPKAKGPSSEFTFQ